MSPLNENPIKIPSVPPTFPRVDIKSYKRYSETTVTLPGFANKNLNL